MVRIIELSLGPLGFSCVPPQEPHHAPPSDLLCLLFSIISIFCIMEIFTGRCLNTLDLICRFPGIYFSNWAAVDSRAFIFPTATSLGDWCFASVAAVEDKFLVPDTKYMAPGRRSLAPGTRCLGTRGWVSGPWEQIQGTCTLITGTW